MSKYQKGVSGNPSGRPRGALNKRTQLAQLMETHAEALVNKTIDLALSGDTIALRLCIERLIPKIINKAAMAVMPDLGTIETTKIMPQLLRSLAGQELTVSELKGLIDILREHDHEIDYTSKKHVQLELNTNDPNEAARIYAQIMKGVV